MTNLIPFLRAKPFTKISPPLQPTKLKKKPLSHPQSWMESIRKAQQQLTMLKLPPLGSSLTLGSVSRQASTYLGDGDFDMDELCGDTGLPRTPRGSSRASRVSSLAHSHRFVSPGRGLTLQVYFQFVFEHTNIWGLGLDSDGGRGCVYVVLLGEYREEWRFVWYVGNNKYFEFYKEKNIFLLFIK